MPRAILIRMGHRLSKIYTRTGDAGETGLGDGSRVPKDAARAAALAHLARTVCRRAERAVVALGRNEIVAGAGRIYLNRLSDLLFVLGRVLNGAGGRGDVLWQPGRNK